MRIKPLIFKNPILLDLEELGIQSNKKVKRNIWMTITNIKESPNLVASKNL